MQSSSQNLHFGTALALDVGEKRIGVASANLSVRFASPLTTLSNPETFISDILELCERNDATCLIIGRPRGLNGQETEQTRRVKLFGDDISARLTSAHLQIPVYWIDEALTSAQADAELRSHGRSYDKGEIDSLAATYILDDFLKEIPGSSNG